MRQEFTMQKFLSLSILVILLIIANISIIKSQTCMEMVDSAYFYLDNQLFEPALKWAHKAEETAKTKFGEKDTNYIAAVSSLCQCYVYLGNNEKGLEYGEKVYLLTKEIIGTENKQYAEATGNLGYIYNRIGNYEKALNYIGESLSLYRKIYKGDHSSLSGSIGNMADILNTIGEYKQAEVLYNEALDMDKRIFNGDHPYLAMSINALGMFYKARGDNTKAELFYKEALDMRRRLYMTDHPELASSINNMAYLYDSRGDYSKSDTLYKEALAMYRRIYKENHPALALAVNNVAFIYDRLGNFKEAEKLFKEALEMRRDLFKNDNTNLAQSINNLGGFYNAQGNYTAAEPYFKEALDMYRRIYKKDNTHLAQSINNMANFYNNIADYKQAEKYYLEALEMRRRIFPGDHPDLVQSITNLAGFYSRTGEYSKAEVLSTQALEMNKNILNSYFPILSENEKKMFWSMLSNDFENYNGFAVRRSSHNPSLISHMYDNQLYSKALLLNSTSRIKSRIINSGDSILIARYTSWNEHKEALVKLYKMTTEDIKAMNINIDSIENVTNDMEKELSLKSESFKQSYEKKKVNWKSIQTLLKPDEAAIEVVRFRIYDKKNYTDTIYYAFLIVNEQTEEHPDLVVLDNGKELENEFYTEYRNNTRSKVEDKKSFGRYWSKLFEKTKGYKKIFFSADGVYNKLNPSTLMLPDGKYLIDVQDIQQVNTTKDLLIGYYQSKQESNIFNSALLIGNPNFSLSEEQVQQASRKIRGNKEEDKSYEQLVSIRGVNLTKLPGTEKEINDISGFLKSKSWIVNSYLGDSALKTAVKTANNPRVLHIATHGLFLEDVKRESKSIFGFDEKKLIENPLLRSGLFFTGADNYLKKENASINDEEDNGLLTAYEAMNLNLDKTELVVLSACETGLGEIQNGEGVFGLRRAFQQAGAKTIMMSLWKVNDDATQQLMSLFYKNLVTGMTKRDAFSKAQQEVRSKYKDPYYWGAFVMVGE